MKEDLERIMDEGVRILNAGTQPITAFTYQRFDTRIELAPATSCVLVKPCRERRPRITYEDNQWYRVDIHERTFYISQRPRLHERAFELEHELGYLHEEYTNTV